MSTDHTMSRPHYEGEETTSNKTFRKIRENPMVPVGMAGFFVAVAYGIKHFKNRPKGMTTSMYVMRFRVFAQSIAVGAMGLGIAYTVFKDSLFNKDSHSKAEAKK